MSQHSRIFCAALLLCSMPAWSAGNDELWELTVSMDLGGMSMPVRPTNSCIPKGGNYKPEKDQHDCQVSDYKVSGHKVSWKMACTGAHAMSGDGEVSKTATTMKGVIHLRSQNMQMTQVINGKRVGSCDAAAERQQMASVAADIKQRSDDSLKQVCESSMARDVESGGFGSDTLYRGDQLCASYLPTLCDKARANAATLQGYSTYADNQASPMAKIQNWGWVLSGCQIDLEKQRPLLCKQARTDKEYRFLIAHCPAEAQALSEQECANFDYGRSLSTDTKASMCIALRGKGSAGYVGSSSQATPTNKGSDNPAAQALEAVKKLKGMFGF